ncbi:MAG: hypothetical protein LBF78_02275, partial [Treponema sp.]|nr:hypothetical protein [Treponema sp.]
MGKYTELKEIQSQINELEKKRASIREEILKAYIEQGNEVVLSWIMGLKKNTIEEKELKAYVKQKKKDVIPQWVSKLFVMAEVREGDIKKYNVDKSYLKLFFMNDYYSLNAPLKKYTVFVPKEHIETLTFTDTDFA